MAHTEAIIQSMTPKERDNPSIINYSRKKRIANGCGLSVEQVNKLLKQFEAMQKMTKQLPAWHAARAKNAAASRDWATSSCRFNRYSFVK